MISLGRFARRQIQHDASWWQHQGVTSTISSSDSSELVTATSEAFHVPRKLSGDEVVTTKSTSIYVDSFVGASIRQSDSSSSSSGAHVARDRYIKAILESDFAALRRNCEMRGIDHEGLSRYQILEKLVSSFTFLSK